MEIKELNLNEMEEVAGGRGGSPHMLPEKPGFKVYKIKSHDTLSKIAGRYGTTADYLKSINSTIHNVNDITAGFYIYVPACPAEGAQRPGQKPGPFDFSVCSAVSFGPGILNQSINPALFRSRRIVLPAKPAVRS